MMGKKLKNVMLHMMVSATAVSLLFGSTMCVFAEDTEADVQIAEMNDAEMTPNSEKLVSRKAPKEVPENLTLNKTDVLGDLMGSERLFYSGE